MSIPPPRARVDASYLTRPAPGQPGTMAEQLSLARQPRPSRSCRVAKRLAPHVLDLLTTQIADIALTVYREVLNERA
jgi:hypothetical protein